MVDPVVLWGAIAAMAGFIAWFVRWALTHLESDVAHARRVTERGVRTAEEAVVVAESK